MTRINTNISAIIGLNNLNTAQDQLQTSLTRLSTGLRINSAADDPSGMIANNEFQSDIASSNQAISNSQQDQQMLSTADSALSQISSLLDTIRGLVTQAANTATMTPDEIEANQQQVNASLTAINQIAGTTTFGNQELLNGSLNFNTQGVNSSQISGLMVNQASLGTGQQNVNVQVLKQATQAALNYNGTTLSNAANLEITGAAGSQTVQLGAGSTLQQMADSINAATGGTGVQAVVNQQTAQTATAGTTTMLNVGGQDGFAVTSMGTGQTQGDFYHPVLYPNQRSHTAAGYRAGRGDGRDQPQPDRHHAHDPERSQGRRPNHRGANWSCRHRQHIARGTTEWFPL